MPEVKGCAAAELLASTFVRDIVMARDSVRLRDLVFVREQEELRRRLRECRAAANQT